MEEFYMDSRQLYQILKEKGVTSLDHANTVLTAKTFIEQGALLSRGYVEDNKLIQTEQESDNKDKEVNVWHDIFLDGKDLSVHFNRPNRYGPVLFVMKLEMLLSPNIWCVLITKDNPMYWSKEIPLSQRYYSSLSDFATDYLNRGWQFDARLMFTFRNADKLIKLNKFCEKIILDKTGRLYNNINVDDTVYNNLRSTLDANKLSHIVLEERRTHIGKYIAMITADFIRLFRSVR